MPGRTPYNGFDGNGAECQLSFAVAEAITGPYTFAGWCYGAGGKHVMDMTAYQDEDGQAYVFYSANTDRTGHWVDKLAEDYLSVTGNVSHPSTFDREAPCVFKTGGRYFLYFSECSGWAPNQGHYVTATRLAGPWTTEAPFGDAATFKSQGGCIFGVTGTARTTFIYVGDQWTAKREPGLDEGDPSDLGPANYLWLPIEVTGSTMSIRYWPEWSLDLWTGVWTGKPTR